MAAIHHFKPRFKQYHSVCYVKQNVTRHALEIKPNIFTGISFCDKHFIAQIHNLLTTWIFQHYPRCRISFSFLSEQRKVSRFFLNKMNNLSKCCDFVSRLCRNYCRQPFNKTSYSSWKSFKTVYMVTSQRNWTHVLVIDKNSQHDDKKMTDKIFRATSAASEVKPFSFGALFKIYAFSVKRTQKKQQYFKYLACGN